MHELRSSVSATAHGWTTRSKQPTMHVVDSTESLNLLPQPLGTHRHRTGLREEQRVGRRDAISTLRWTQLHGNVCLKHERKDWTWEAGALLLVGRVEC